MTTITPAPGTLLEQRRNAITNPYAAIDTTRYALAQPGGVTGTMGRTTVAGATPRTTTALATLTSAAPTWWGVRFGSTIDLIPVVPGVQYTFSAYLRPVHTSGATTAGTISWVNANGSIISQAIPAGAAHVLNVWERRSVTATAPAGAVGAFVDGRITNGGSNTHQFMMNALLWEAAATAGPYFDGASVDAPPLYYRWAGAANASPSTENAAVTTVITPTLVDGYEASRLVRTLAHRRANTDRVSVVFQPPEPRQGTLTLLFDDAMDAASALAILSLQTLFTLTDTDVPEVDMTFAVADGSLTSTLEDETRSVWLLEVPFVEVLP